MRIAVVGSRSFSDEKLLVEVLDEECSPGDTIVSGGARGADTMAERYAFRHGLHTIVFRPDWQKYGRSAGFRRNAYIVVGADKLIAFWDGQSRGTAHSIGLAKERGIPVRIIGTGAAGDGSPSPGGRDEEETVS